MISARELWFVDEQRLYDLYDPTTGGIRRGPFRGYAAAGHAEEETTGSVILPALALEVIADALESVTEAGYSVTRNGEEFTVIAANGESYRVRPNASGHYYVSHLPWTWVEVSEATPVLEAW